MSAAEAFVDSNVFLYLLSGDTAKADRAEAVIARGVIISVQVLNEVANVLRRKLGMSWAETNQVLGLARSSCRVVPLTVETHAQGLHIAKRYGLSVYDAMIVAAALLAECKFVYSEDMQHGLIVERKLKVVNPFRAT